MTEPDIIHSNRPHQVSIPEGSHVAVSKTGTPQEPSVHKNYRAGGDEPDLPAADRSSPAPASLPADRMAHLHEAQAPDHTDLSKVPLPTQADARATERPIDKSPSSDFPVGTPSPAPESTPPAPITAQDSPIGAESMKESVMPQETVMPEMDFPARVVHLRIENEQLRTRLEKLDADR